MTMHRTKKVRHIQIKKDLNLYIHIYIYSLYILSVVCRKSIKSYCLRGFQNQTDIQTDSTTDGLNSAIQRKSTHYNLMDKTVSALTSLCGNIA